MTFKSYRTNTDFDIVNFVGRDAHTADGKYVLYVAQRNILKENYTRFLIAQKRKKHRIDVLLSTVANTPAVSMRADHRFELSLELEELQASDENDRLNLEGGRKEIEFYDRIIAELKPLCKYAHLDLIDQQEAVQQEEWRLEFIERAKTHIQSVGYIPADQLAAMKAHPDFKAIILPEIQFLMKNKQELLEYTDVKQNTDSQLPLLDEDFAGKYQLTA